MKILASEIRFLQHRILELLPEEAIFTLDRLTHGSLEIRSILARVV